MAAITLNLKEGLRYYRDKLVSSGDKVGQKVWMQVVLFKQLKKSGIIVDKIECHAGRWKAKINNAPWTDVSLLLRAEIIKQ